MPTPPDRRQQREQQPPRVGAVRNAADPRQVKFGERMEKRRAERLDNAMLAVMNTEPGRIVLATLLRRAGVYKSIWHPSSEIHYNAGRQDFGHELMADLTRLNEDLYQQLEREDRNWARGEERAVEAEHAKRPDERESNDER